LKSQFKESSALYNEDARSFKPVSKAQLKNLSIERIHKKESLSPRYMLTEGDADSFPENHKILQIQNQWNSLKSKLESTTNARKSVQSSDGLMSLTKLKGHAFLADRLNVSITEICENVSVHTIRTFNAFTRDDKKRLVPLTKINLNDSGVYISSSSSSFKKRACVDKKRYENLLSKATKLLNLNNSLDSIRNECTLTESRVGEKKAKKNNYFKNLLQAGLKLQNCK